MLAGLYPGPHRPRARPRRGHRSADHLRPAARPPAGDARRLPPAARRAAGVPRDELPEDHPFAPLPRSLPGRPHAPEPWLLGSSPQSGVWAAELGLPYAFADFINPRRCGDRRELSRALRPVGGAARARGVVAALSAICAETDAEAERLAASSRMALALLRRGRLIPVPPPEKALRFLRRGRRRRRGRPGRPAPRAADGRRLARRPCARASRSVAGATTAPTRSMVVTITFDHGARRRCYELIAEAFGLAPERRPAAGALAP